MRKIITKLLLGIIAGILLLNIGFYFLQPGMLFYPHTQLMATPKDWGLNYEEVSLTTPDKIRLHGWFIPAKKAKPVVLFFHGNAGNISHRGDSLAVFNQLGLNVLIIDYRGYGNSEGSMSEQGAYTDALTAWQYLIAQRGYQPNDIIIFGRSLGGAVATQLATQVKAKALMLESTFSSVNDMADYMMPLLSRLVYLRYTFNTAGIIDKINAPLLLMHSQDDDIVPYELGEKVFAAAKSPKFFFELSGGHNGGFMNNVVGYKQAISWFIENN